VHSFGKKKQRVGFILGELIFSFLYRDDEFFISFSGALLGSFETGIIVTTATPFTSFFERKDATSIVVSSPKTRRKFTTPNKAED
jgi:hypothetical protein